jgi:hypothetical protein
VGLPPSSDIKGNANNHLYLLWWITSIPNVSNGEWQ